MLIFWRLLFAHLIADFTLQSNKINELKRRSRAGMALHVAMHPMASLLVVWPYVNSVWFSIGSLPIYGWLAIAIITLTHFLEDAWRVRGIKRYGEKTDDIFYFILDQAIHVGVIFAVSGTWVETTSVFLPEKWPVLGSLAVGATHFSVVFIYFLEKSLFGKSYPKTREKYLSIAERGLAFLSLVFIPSFFLALIAALGSLLIGRFFIYKDFSRSPKFSWTAGALLTFLFGLTGRLVF